MSIEARLQLQLASEGLALVRLGAQSVHLQAMLVGLIAVRINSRRAGTRLPRLGLGRGRRGGQDRQDEKGADGHHGEEDGAGRADLQA